MLFLVFIFIVGGSYVLWRFNSISNKSLFYKSTLFTSLVGTVVILFFAITVTNIFSPAYYEEASPDESSDSLWIAETDTTPAGLLHKDPAFHYELINTLNSNYNSLETLLLIKKHYGRFVTQNDSLAQAIGHFGLGVIEMSDGKFERALRHFEKIPDADMPYLHFCKGEVYLNQKDTLAAEAQFRQELSIPNGNFVAAYAYLLERYKASEDFISLGELLNVEAGADLFPDDLARTTLLRTGEPGHYVVWVFKTVLHQTRVEGFIAALAITIIWLVYLFRLDVFHPDKFIKLVLMFVSGVFVMPLIFCFNDTMDIINSWWMDGSFWNDLFYAVFMIGVPEELTKILPFLILIFFAGSLKEPIDYIIYASASALGFAFIENLLYFQDVSNGIIHGRAYLSVICHMVATSFVAYGFVVSRFKMRKKGSLLLTLPISFLAAAAAHGVYDFLLFHQFRLLFFMYFIFIIQVWIIIINNCLNNSSFFSYKLVPRTEKSRIYIALALTSIFALEYMMVGFSKGASQANEELYSNVSFAGFLIVFFSSHLSSFNLIRGYWRDIYFSSREKRGYGTLQPRSLLVSWYFVNAMRAHNYVGLRISLYNDPYNHVLADILEGSYEGTIINRVILYEGKDDDPHWFIVKLDRRIPISDASQQYVLIKLRNQNDSLPYESEVQVFFKAITDVKELKSTRPRKDQFPFCGWAYASIQHTSANTPEAVLAKVP